MFKVGVPCEIKSGENRVGMTPSGVASVRATGADVVVETRCGEGSGYADADYAAAGATIAGTAADAWEADLVVKVKEPLASEYRFFAPGKALFAYLHLAAAPDLARVLLRTRVIGIAYETVRDGTGLPLLRPMSEVAGALAVQAGARGLEKGCGGRGILLAGAAGVPPGKVCVIGAGNAGRKASRLAMGLGADVTLLDVSPGALEAARTEIGDGVRTLASDPATIEREVREADLVVSTALRSGEKAPVLIPRSLLRKMKRGAVIVDIAIDQGGTLETSRPTTHADPYFVEDGIVHYCVTNMPAAVPRTSTLALAGATVRFVVRIAERGVARALREDPVLRAGLTTYDGHLVAPGVAQSLGVPCVPPETVLG